MLKTDNINILKYEINSSQGDLKQTLKAIKNQDIKVSSKGISTDFGDATIPFYAFKDEIKQNQQSIKDALKDIVSRVISTLDTKQKKSTALIVGTSLIDWHLVDAINGCAYEYKKTNYTSKKYSIDSYAKELASEFGLNEFTMTINTACTSSANAMLEAKNLINCGVVDYAIVVGLEVFSPIMSSGFYAMELISQTDIKPFDTNRDGLILGEAIGAILLGKDNSKWSLEGGFSNCNSATITSVGADGKECVEVMQKALDDANITTDNITALKAHATGSNSNDLAEINAISKVFNPSITFTALKPFVGHTIGASGVLEIIIFISCIDDGFIPKTLSCHTPIVQDYMPINEHKKCNGGVFMCNYFGFGGNNISLIIKKENP